jgi:hypothetical protein
MTHLRKMMLEELERRNYAQTTIDTAEWRYDPNFLTEVEVNLIEKGPKLTSLTLEHRNIEKFGTQAQEIWSAFDSEGGWTGTLKSFATIAETEATGRE